MDKEKRYITKASFARECNVSCQLVNYWINNGIIGIVTFPNIEGEFIDIKEDTIEYFKSYNGYIERYAKKE
jgi:hypothetical protein